MEISLDTLLSLLQIAIALGLFYIGLPRARYRKILLEKIGRAYDRAFDQAEPDLEHTYRELLGNDRNFADAHHEILKWLGELSARRNDVSDSWYGFWPKGKAVDLPWQYRWYKTNGDRWIVFVLTSAIPIAQTVVLLGSSDPVSYMTACCHLVLLSIAAICVSVHVGMGMWIEHGLAKQFDKALETIDNALNLAIVKEEI